MGKIRQGLRHPPFSFQRHRKTTTASVASLLPLVAYAVLFMCLLGGLCWAFHLDPMLCPLSLILCPPPSLARSSDHLASQEGRSIGRIQHVPRQKVCTQNREQVGHCAFFWLGVLALPEDTRCPARLGPKKFFAAPRQNQVDHRYRPPQEAASFVRPLA